MIEKCSRCGHDFDPHAMVATTGNPLQGGIMLCPVPGCECFRTWGTAYGPDHKPVIPGTGRDDVYVPPQEEIAHIRSQVQSGELGGRT